MITRLGAFLTHAKMVQYWLITSLSPNIDSLTIDAVLPWHFTKRRALGEEGRPGLVTIVINLTDDLVSRAELLLTRSERICAIRIPA